MELTRSKWEGWKLASRSGAWWAMFDPGSLPKLELFAVWCGLGTEPDEVSIAITFGHSGADPLVSCGYQGPVVPRFEWAVARLVEWHWRRWQAKHPAPEIFIDELLG